MRGVAAALTLVPRRPWHVGMAALGAGLALATTPTPLAFAVAATSLVGLSLLRAPPLGALAAALVLGGAAIGDWRLGELDAPMQKVREGAPLQARAELLTPPRASPFGSSAEARITTGRLEGARVLLRAPRWAPMPRRSTVGMELTVQGRVKRPSRSDSDSDSASAGAADPAGAADSARAADSIGAADSARAADSTGAADSGSPTTADSGSGFDFAAHLRRRGVAAELLLDQVRATGRRRGGVLGLLDRMREHGERAVVAGMSPADGALLRGMVLGQDEAISASVREDFRASGLAHLLGDTKQARTGLEKVGRRRVHRRTRRQERLATALAVALLA